jgi:hypothetical protein
MPEETSTHDAGGLWVWMFFGFIGFVLWASWGAAFGCLLADADYVTNRCALKHLQQPACNNERDILEVDEVRSADTVDAQGRKYLARKVIYKFRKRPVDGPVSDAILRDTEYLIKNKNGKWQAVCEIVPE